jgi:hypothetical protein
MARVTITIEDLENGKVRVVSDPSFENMIRAEISGHTISSAFGYAFTAINAIRNEAKKTEPENRILIPKLK